MPQSPEGDPTIHSLRQTEPKARYGALRRGAGPWSERTRWRGRDSDLVNPFPSPHGAKLRMFASVGASLFPGIIL